MGRYEKDLPSHKTKDLLMNRQEVFSFYPMRGVTPFFRPKLRLGPTKVFGNPKTFFQKGFSAGCGAEPASSRSYSSASFIARES